VAVASNFGYEVLYAKVFGTTSNTAAGDYSDLTGKYIPLASAPEVVPERTYTPRKYVNDYGSDSFVVTKRSKYSEYGNDSVVDNTTVSFKAELGYAETPVIGTSNLQGPSVFALFGEQTPSGNYVMNVNIPTQYPDMTMQLYGKTGTQYLMKDILGTSLQVSMSPSNILSVDFKGKAYSTENDDSGTEYEDGTTAVTANLPLIKQQFDGMKPFLLQSVEVTRTDSNDPTTPTIEVMCPTQLEFTLSTEQEELKLLGPKAMLGRISGVKVEGSYTITLKQNEYLSPRIDETEAIHQVSLNVVVKTPDGAEEVFFQFPNAVITEVTDADGGREGATTRTYKFTCVPNETGVLMSFNEDIIPVSPATVTHYGVLVTHNGQGVTHNP
jgi:hypothetical protein